MHDPNPPLQPIMWVGPAVLSLPTRSDAVIRFAGKGLSGRTPSTWKIKDSQVVAGEGELVSKASSEYLQVNAKWRVSAGFTGPRHGDGRNGVTLMDQFESRYSGVLIDQNQEIDGVVPNRQLIACRQANSVGPIRLSAHYFSVHFQYIWVRTFSCPGPCN
jgi:hypothetical protein